MVGYSLRLHLLKLHFPTCKIFFDIAFPDWVTFMNRLTAFTLMLLELSNNFVTNILNKSISRGIASDDDDQLQKQEKSNSQICPSITHFAIVFTLPATNPPITFSPPSPHTIPDRTHPYWWPTPLDTQP